MRGAHTSSIAGLIVLIACGFGHAAGDTLHRARVGVADAHLVADGLSQEGFLILPRAVTADSLELIATGDQLDQLQQRGLDTQIIEVGGPLREAQDGQSELPLGYPELSTIIAHMEATAASAPDICRFIDLTEMLDTPPTFEGRHLYAVKISDFAHLDEDEPAFLMVSAHHPHEAMTPIIALETMDRFVGQYGVNPTITALVDEYEIWIAPLWNPDGYDYVYNVDRFWRKNRCINEEGIGVDLNRNYPIGWDDECGGSPDPTTQVYRGPEPASETETSTMIRFASDRNFTKVADIHSFAREVRYGYGCGHHPFTDFLEEEAVALSESSLYLGIVRQSCCMGGDIQYHIAARGSYAFLWETGLAFQPPFPNAAAEASLIFGGVMTMLQRPIPVAGHVTDAMTGAPLLARVSPVGAGFENHEGGMSNGRYGRYHTFTPPGQFTLKYSAFGYVPRTATIDVTSNGTAEVDVELVPAPLDSSVADLMVQCFSGPDVLTLPAECSSTELTFIDYDSDGDVDLRDFAVLHRYFKP